MTQISSKPKIIYNTLENLVSSSSFSKVQTQSTELQTIKNNRLDYDNLASKNSSKQNASRHGLKSKDKIAGKIFFRSKSKQTTERSKNSTSNKQKSVTKKPYFDQIQRIYLDLEREVHRSKRQFFEHVINNYQNELKLQQDLKKLVQKSEKIKQVLLYKNQQDQSSTEVNQCQLAVLNPNNFENIDLLSRANLKNKNELRLKKAEVSKKLSVYEQVLKRKI